MARGYRYACFSFSTLLAAGILMQPVFPAKIRDTWSPFPQET